MGKKRRKKAPKHAWVRLMRVYNGIDNPKKLPRKLFAKEQKSDKTQRYEFVDDEKFLSLLEPKLRKHLLREVEEIES